jgi:hypothetical protein
MKQVHKQVRKVVKKPPVSKPKKIAVVVGRAYTLEELGSLISTLTGDNTDREISGVAEFAENQAAVSEAAAQSTEVSGTEIMELVIASILKNERKMLTKFGKEGNKKALSFIAKSESIPPAIRTKAAAILTKVKAAIPSETPNVQAPQEKTPAPKAPAVKQPPASARVIELPSAPKAPQAETKSPEPAVKVPEAKAPAEKFRKAAAKAPAAKAPTLVPVIYTPKEVKVLVQKLESTIPEMRIPAAVKFVHDYPKIVPAVAKMPLVTVTQITIKAVKVIKQDTDKVLNRMVQKKMVPALLFLSSLAQVPLAIRNRAHREAEKLKVEILSPARKKMKIQKTYSPFELAALLDGLGSVERVRVVWAATEFLKNYEIIAKAISKTPGMSVTAATDKAMKAVQHNLGAVLTGLKKTKDVKALSFLAHSAKVPDRVRKKAGQALNQLLMIQKKKKAPFLKLAMDYKDKD